MPGLLQNFRRQNSLAVTRRLQFRRSASVHASARWFFSVQEPPRTGFVHSLEPERTPLNGGAAVQHPELALPKPGVRGSSPLRDAILDTISDA